MVNQIEELKARLKLNEAELAAEKRKNENLICENRELKNRWSITTPLPKFTLIQTNLINSTNAMMSFIDKDYNYVIVNDQWCKFKGQNREEIIGKTIKDFWGSDVFEIDIKPRFDDALNGKTLNYQAWLTNYEGNKHFFNISFHPHYHESVIEGVLITSSDITDRIRAENNFLTVFNSLSDSIFIHSFDDNGHNSFIDVNDMACFKYGYSREELLSLSPIALQSKKNPPGVTPDELRHTLIKDDYAHFESIHQKKTGEIFPVEITSKIIFVDDKRMLLSIVRDVSEQKAREEELRIKDIRNQSIIETALEGFLVLDLNGVILDVNEKYCILSGYSKNELSGLNIQNLEISKSGIEAPYYINLLIQNGSACFETEHRKKDGTSLQLEVSAQHLDLQGGIIVAFLRDISKDIINKKLLGTRLDLATYSMAHSLDETIQHTLDIAEKVTNSKIGFYHFLEEDQKTLRLQAWSTNTVKNMCAAEGKGNHYDIDKAGVWTDCVSLRKAVIHNDYPSLSHKKGLPEGHAAVIRELVVPIFRGEYIVAIIGVGNKETYYTDQDITDLQLIADLSWDIIETNISRNALAESEEKYRSLIESVRDGIIIIKEGLIQYVNRVMIELSGYNENDFLGKPFLDFVSQYDKEKVAGNYQKRLAGEYLPTEYEFNVLIKDGSELPLEVTSTVFTFFNEKAELVFLKDIRERKSAQEALQLSEYRNRTLLNAIPDLMFLVSRDGTYLDYKARTEDELFMPPEYFIGKKFHEVLPPNLASICESKLEDAFESGSLQTFEYQMAINDEPLFYEARVEANSKANEAIFIIRDITERKKTEELNRLTEQKYQSLFENMLNGLAYCKMIFNNSEPVDFIYLDVNKAFENLTGLKNVTGKKVSEVIPGIKESDPELFAIYARVALTGKPESFEMNVAALDIWFSVSVYSPQREYFTAIFDVITERKKAEKEIALKNELLRLTSDMAKVGGWEFYTDTLQGTWTDEVAKIHGLDPSDPTSVELGISFYTPESRNQIETAIRKAISEAKPYDLELEMITRNGVKKWVRTMAMPIIKGDKVIKLQGIFQDISYRKETELRLENEKKMLRTLIETMPDMVILKDIDGKYLFCNNEYEKFYGKRENELLGKTDYDFVSREKADHYRKIDNDVLIRGCSVYSKEEVTYADDGHKAILEVIKTPLLDSLGNAIGLLAIARNITEQTIYEIQLKKEHDYVISILESMSDAFLALDENWKFTYMNENAGRVFNKDPKKMIGRHIWTEFPKGIGQPFHTAYEKAMLDKKSVTIEEYYTPFNKWFENYLNPTDNGLLIFFRDITERKLSENALQESESRYRLLFEQNPAPMLIYERDTLKLLAINEAFLRHYSYSREEALAMRLPDLYPEEEKEPIIKLAGELRGYQNVGEWHHLRKGNELITITVRSTDIQYEEHDSRVAVITDVTDRKIAEEKIKMMNIELENRVQERTAQLETANRDLEAFAYSISHDLRSPLRHIDGFTHIIQKMVPNKDAEIEGYFRKISDSTTKMASMIDSLLTFSRLGRKPLQKSKVDLNEIVDSVIKHFEPDTANRIIEWEIGRLPQIFGDRELLQLALENLISNAIKFTSKKEKAVIKIAQDITIENTFFVKDNGAGFDMAYSDKLFGVFQRLHTVNEYEGTGIGLANVKQIIVKHGGTIRAESEIDKGAVFYITL